MSAKRSETVRALSAVVEWAAAHLSAIELQVLAAHPEAVERALSSTAKALSQGALAQTVEEIGGEPPKHLSPQDARAELDRRTVESSSDGLLTSEEMAARLGLKGRQSVHNRLRKGVLMGWEGARRGCVLPAGQLDAKGRTVIGLDKLLPLFPDGYAAWVWLTTPSAALDGRMPLDVLKGGRLDPVLSAAAGYVQGDFV